MADATSVGAIELNLEVNGDLDDGIGISAKDIAETIRKKVDNMGSDLFKNMRMDLVASLSKVNESIISCLSDAKNKLEQYAQQLSEILRKISNVNPVYNQPQSDVEPNSTDTASSSPRGPPSVSIQKPKIKFDPQFDTDMFKQKYVELENMMDVYDTQILTKQAERKKALESFTPNMNANAEEALNKSILKLDIQISKLQDAASRTSISLSAMDRKLNESASEAVTSSSRFQKFGNIVSSIKTKLSNVNLSNIKNGMKSVSNATSKATSVLSKFRNVCKKAFNVSIHPLKTIKDGFDKITGSSKRASKGVDGSRMSMGRLIQSFVIFSMVFPLVSRAIMALGQNLWTTLKTNEQFTASLNTVRSNLATAFTPIVQAIMPALNALMSALASITGYIAAFTSLLFGKTYSASQQATQGIYNAKDAMGAYGDSAEKAAKEASKAIMGFDEINKLDDKNSSSGGGGGGTNVPVYTPSEIDTSGIKKTVDKIKNLFKNGKYEEIGEIVGKAINKGINKVTAFISWDNVGSQVTKFVDAFTRIFNSTIKEINWFNIGKMFGTGVNTLSNTLYLLFTGINWKQLGSALGSGLNGIVKTVDWPKLGATIGSFFQGILNGLTGFITTTDWPAVGKSLADGLMGIINSINWGQFGKTLSDGVKGLISAVRNYIMNIQWEQLGNDISTFLLAIDWWGIITGVIDVICRAIVGLAVTVGIAAGNIALALWDGLCQGITEFFADPGEFIRKNIVDPFVNWIRDLFGIHSPSTVMAEIGGFLIEGLQNGISNLIPNLLENIGTWFSGIGTTISETWDKVKKWTSDTWTDVKTAVSEKVTNIAASVSSGFQDACTAVSTKCGEIKDAVTTKFNDITNWIGGLGDTLWSNATSIFNSFCSGVKSVDIKGTVQGVVNGATDWLSNLWSSASTWGSDMMSGLASGINGAKKWVTGAVSSVADTISSWLHFSRPDVGPLHYYEEWMPDFMQGMAKTLDRSSPALIDKVRALATEMSMPLNGLSEPTIAFAGESQLNVDHYIKDDSKDKDISLKDVINELRELKEEMKNVKESIKEKDTDIYLDDEKVTKKIVDNVNKDTRKNGKCPIDM